MSEQRPLTKRQAYNCEHAKEPKCVCRCGGALHGAKRGGETSDGAMDVAFFESLAENDPHYVLSDEAKKARRAAYLERKRQERAEAQARRWAAIAEYERNRPTPRDWFDL